MEQLTKKEESAIEKIVIQTGVSEETGLIIKNAFSEIESKLSEWKEKVALIKVTDASQVREMKLARETRLALKDVRLDADKLRKALKENNNRENRAIQECYNYVKSEIKPMEEHCLLQEKFAELQEQKRLEERKAKRLEELMPYNVAVDMAMIESMGEESWEIYFAGVKKTHEEARIKQEQEERERIEAEKKAEQERIEREKKEAEEREAMRIENERLKKEAEEKEKALAIERAKAEEERKAAEEKARKEREEADRKLAEEKAKQEAERKRIEAENQAKLEDERKERERIQAELKAKQEAEMAEKKRLEKEEQERIAEQQRRNAAPDKEKLQELVKNIRNAELPVVTTEKAKILLANIKSLLEKIAVYTENGIKEL